MTNSPPDRFLSSTSWIQRPSCTCWSSPGAEGTPSREPAASCPCGTWNSSPMTRSRTWSPAHWRENPEGGGRGGVDIRLGNSLAAQVMPLPFFKWKISYLKGKVALSICMHTRKGYSENWTVVMKSSDASVSKLTSTPALMKSMSTVTFPVTTNAPLKTRNTSVRWRCASLSHRNKIIKKSSLLSGANCQK